MTEPKKIICLFDTAINLATADTADPATQKIPLVEYAKTRDMAVITPHLILGNLPTVFLIVPLSRAQVNGPVARCSTDHERAVMAFVHGVVAVENAPDANGQIVNKWAPTGVVGDKFFCTQSDMEFFSPAEVCEIGSVIYQLSFLPRRLWSKLQPPSTSLEILARMGP